MYADPYLNTDAGTMSPFEHGEVFVLDDGGEVNFQISGDIVVRYYLFFVTIILVYKKGEFLFYFIFFEINVTGTHND